MKPSSIIIAILFTIVSAQAQTPKVIAGSYHLGEQVIVIPAPADFEEAASQFEVIKSRFTQTEAPENDLLAVHLQRADCDKLRAGELGPLTFYTKVSVPKSVRELDFSTQAFAALVSEFRKNGSQYLDTNSPALKTTIERLSQRVSELSGTDTKVDLGQPVNLGEFDTRPNVYGVMLLMNFKAQTSAGERSVLLLCGLSYVRVGQRLIYVYTYRKYEATSDVEFLRHFTKEWLGQILAAN
jgi:hypothetical protein